MTAADRLASLRAAYRDATLVLGTGCFDILHVGHLYFLTEARRQGDVLVVGVNSDRAVRALKGPTRPIVGEADRAALVGAFACTSAAFVYDDVVADAHIAELAPDVYVIGAESVDAYPSEVAAAHSVGARVHVVERRPSLSTTDLVAALRER